MQKGRMFAIGVLFVTLGGSGLAEIATSNQGLFWACAIIFSIGFGLCLAGYGRDD